MHFIILEAAASHTHAHAQIKATGPKAPALFYLLLSQENIIKQGRREAGRSCFLFVVVVRPFLAFFLFCFPLFFELGRPHPLLLIVREKEPCNSNNKESNYITTNTTKQKQHAGAGARATREEAEERGRRGPKKETMRRRLRCCRKHRGARGPRRRSASP
jgi:hypothetical protein